MPQVKSAKFSRLGVLRKVDAANLLKLLQPYREYLARSGFVWPASAQEPIDYESLSKVLVAPQLDTPLALMESLELIDLLADEEQLFEFEGDYHALVSKVQQPGEGAADVALKILLQAPDVAWRAFDKKAVRVKRSLSSYLANEPWAIGEPTPELMKQLECEMAPWFASTHRSPACRVHALPQGESWAFIIRHGDPVSRIGTITEDGDSSSLLFRPERLDVAYYNSRTREWLISGISKVLIKMYCEKLGAVLHNSTHALVPSQRYTLTPLRQGPDVLLDTGIEAVRGALLKEVTVRLPNDGEITIRKADVFGNLMQLIEQFGDAIQFLEATFALQLTQRRSWLRIVVSPERNKVSVSSASAVVDAWLEDRGFITHAHAGVLARD